VYREAGVSEAEEAQALRAWWASPRPALSGANQEWALDFAHDAIATDRKIRGTERGRRLHASVWRWKVDTGFARPAGDAGAGRGIAVRGLPQAIRCDNGRS